MMTKLSGVVLRVHPTCFAFYDHEKQSAYFADLSPEGDVWPILEKAIQPGRRVTMYRRAGAPTWRLTIQLGAGLVVYEALAALVSTILREQQIPKEIAG